MGLLTPVAVRVGSIGWMPRLLPQIVWVDQHLQQLSRGRVSLLDVAGLPNIVLTVPGRRTGVPRSTPLLAVPRGASWLVAGSYFGGPKEPVWVKNLEAASSAEVTVKGRTSRVVPRRLDGPDRAAAWQELLAVWPNFALYERRTERVIKVFELAPAD
ncbi:MAG: nitroreductase family deazaflavin-dependent oxidoreductase [Jatrophihabitans sp.]|uniref:nitroreductase family deazaflavin-dependent oxidoreductase n=1 Tax=Jatrophihabitans sp. TaxID=1932789 RepID=UPI003F802544